MIRIHASSTSEADAAWGMAVNSETPCELYLDGVGLLAVVERDPVSRRLQVRRVASDPASALHTAPLARTPHR